MMKLALAFVMILAGTASAKDSTWLLCKGVATHGDGTKTYVVASLLEHRGAADRDLDVTLIYGAHTARGAIVGTAKAPFLGKATAVKLASKRPATFAGTLALATDMTSVALDGKLDDTFGDDAKAKPTTMTAKLACEVLDDAAIGH